MTSSRKKWNNDKKLEIERLHELLAADGASDSQLFIAIKLIQEAAKEKSQLKADTAVDFLMQLAINGKHIALELLLECLERDIGVSDLKKKKAIQLLCRKEMDVQCDFVSNKLLTTICDDQNRCLKESEFRRRVQRIVLQINPSPIIGDTDDSTDPIIDEKVLSTNLKLVLSNEKPIIDLTDELNVNNVFTTVFHLFLLSFKMIDLFFIAILLNTLCLSLISNYFFFSPNFRLLYRNLFDWQTICFSLQVIQIYSFVGIMDRIYHFNNVKLWVKVIKTFDKDCKFEANYFFRKCLFWFTIFMVALALEQNIELLFEAQFERKPTICSSVMRQLMAFLSLLFVVRNNSNLLQIFFIIFHYLCQQYLWEIQTHFPDIYGYLTNYIIILTMFIIIITTRPILSSTSFFLILIPNLLAHTLILSADYESESLNFIISNILWNIHSVFGTTILVFLLSFTRKFVLLRYVPRVMIFVDFYNNFNRTFNWSSFLLYFLSMGNISSRVVRLSFARGKLLVFKIILILFSINLFLQIVLHNERQIKAISKNSYSYDRYYDKCSDKELNHNITKQIECLDLTLNHKMQALSGVNSVKLIQISNNLRNTFDFLTFGFNDYIYRILPKSVQAIFNLNDWRVFEFEVIFQLKYSNREVSVRLAHENMDFVEKLKIGDIYEIEMFYYSIKGTAILLSANCKTCWDVVQWNVGFL